MYPECESSFLLHHREFPFYEKNSLKYKKEIITSVFW